ncbi:MAG: GIY-YIG nuclease family protein [Bauldia sp.]|nr:GIY-YIG nuclease family protein [Bauldia sp.]
MFRTRSRDFQPCVYIMASRRYGTLYVGVTSNLSQRAWQHREGLMGGFTRRYGVKLLVYFEFHETMEAAIRREKQIKEWHRAWKIELIESMNPDWRDLYEELAG